MARPQRNDVDYFPHPVNHGKKMAYIEAQYGNDGYAVWFKILEELGKTDHHYLDLQDPVQRMYIQGRCKITDELLAKIIEDLVKMGEFNKNLWQTREIVYNESFSESIEDAYNRRSNDVTTLEQLENMLAVVPAKDAAPAKSKNIKAAPLLERVQNFRRLMLSKCGGKYSDEMLKAFFTYWSEVSDGGKKMRHEFEKTFNLSGRIGTWASREHKFSKAGGAIPDEPNPVYESKIKNDPKLWQAYKKHLYGKGWELKSRAGHTHWVKTDK